MLFLFAGYEIEFVLGRAATDLEDHLDEDVLETPVLGLIAPSGWLGQTDQ